MAGDPNAKTLWFGDLDPLWDEVYCMTALFGGPVYGLINAKIIRDKVTGAALGYGFLEFDSHENAKNILEHFNGKKVPNFPGRSFKLNWGERKSQPSTAGGSASSGDDGSIFVGDLGPEVTEEILLSTFKSRFPSVISAKIVTDHSTGHTAGYGFVKFGDISESNAAIADPKGIQIYGRTVRISHAQTRTRAPNSPSSMNPAVGMMVPPMPLGSMMYGYGGMPAMTPMYPAAWPQTAPAPAPAPTPAPVDEEATNLTIFVGNLDPTITEEQLAQTFAQFGHVTAARIPQNKGIGFVTMADHATAATAIQHMNGAHLGSRPLRCAWGKKNSMPAGGQTNYSQWGMWPMYGQAVPMPGVMPPPVYVPDFTQGYDHEHANELYRQRFNVLYAYPMYPSPVTMPFVPSS